tara:strand:+ start:2695 stop:3717 length:1023 start_codon:yes stop_codon:yes gene_type:complete
MSGSSNIILVTGAAGFIGSALVRDLLKKGEKVVGIDDLNNYYDENLKLARLDLIKNKYGDSWKFYKCSITNFQALKNIFNNHKPNIVVNLAAQAGVRYSLKNPLSYVDANIDGFVKVMECCKLNDVENFIYASSSSVYGANNSLPYSEEDNVDHPISLYAASKRSNELIAHSYSHLFKIPTTGLRFFSVYGPWGRPDMAPILFAKAILEGKKISVFNNGLLKRDFTYIDDIVVAISRCCLKPATSSEDGNKLTPSISLAPYKIFNIGFGKSIDLMIFIDILENQLDKKAFIDFLPHQPGDAFSTGADNSLLEKWIDFKPKTSLEDGIKLFVNWFRKYYKL